MTTENSIGVFFDIDNTLLPWPSLEWRFRKWLLASDLLSRKQILDWTRQGLLAFWSEGLKGISKSKAYLRGLPMGLVLNWQASLTADRLSLFREAVEHLDRHLARGHRIFLISGTLTPLATVFARQLGGSIEIHATEPETDGRVYSGRIKGSHMSGIEKARAVRHIARGKAIDLRNSYAYGDSLDDLTMLECVGNPFAVNPSRKLRRIAKSRCWKVVEWKSVADLDVGRERQFSSKGNAR